MATKAYGGDAVSEHSVVLRHPQIPCLDRPVPININVCQSVLWVFGNPFVVHEVVPRVDGHEMNVLPPCLRLQHCCLGHNASRADAEQMFGVGRVDQTRKSESQFLSSICKGVLSSEINGYPQPPLARRENIMPC